MWISDEKYHDALQKAFVSGLEQGFTLGTKIGMLLSRRNQEEPLTDSSQTSGPPAFLQQIIDIAKKGGVHYE